jgi:Tfp pilus assembly protein PilN
MRAVNLIPSEQRSGQPVGAGRSQGAAYAVLALIAGVALMAYLYGQAKHQVSSRRAQAATLTAEAQQAQAAAERLAPYTSFIALREQRVQAVDSLVNGRFDWAHVMHEFGRVLPAQTSIVSLSGSIGGAGSSSASATSAGGVPTFALSGCATSQPAVALTLERLHLIDGVSEVTLQASTAGTSNTASSSSSSSSSSGGAGGCTGSDASFSATIAFDPLSGAPAASGATSTSVADQTGSAATTTTQPTGSGAIAR